MDCEWTILEAAILDFGPRDRRFARTFSRNPGQVLQETLTR